MHLTFHYNQNCDLSCSAASACEEAGVELRARAYSPSYGGVFIDRELNDTDVAIIVPETSVRWSGRHVMTTRRLVGDEAIPAWARNFQNWLILNPAHQDGIYSCTFRYAVIEGVKTLHNRKKIAVPAGFDQQLNVLRLQANDFIRWRIGKNKPKRRLGAYGITY